MILPIYVYGSEVLRQQASDIDLEKVDKDKLTQFIADMYETMYKSDGVGLAAPQVGKSQKLVIVDGNDLEEVYPYLKDFKRTMINPEILEVSEETIEYSEGCLSVPNIHCDVERPKKVKVRYFDENFEEKVEEFDDFAARMVQHELDHLAGHVFTDRIAPIRKKMISSKLHNIAKGKVKTYYKTKLEK